MRIQRHAQLRERVAQSAFRGLHRNTSDFTDLLETETTLLIKQKHIALFRRQFRQRTLEGCANLHFRGLVFRLIDGR